MLILRTLRPFGLWLFAYTVLDCVLLFFLLFHKISLLVFIPILFINLISNISFLKESLFQIKAIYFLIFNIMFFVPFFIYKHITLSNIMHHNFIFAILLFSYLSFFIKCISSVSFFSKNKELILFCGSEKNCIAFDNFIRINHQYSNFAAICTENNANSSTITDNMDRVKKYLYTAIRSGKILKKVVVDTYENYNILLEKLQQDYLELEIDCLNVKNTYQHFIEKNTNVVSLKNPSSTLFSGLTVLLISNNYDFIKNFIKISKTLEVSDFIILSDDTKIVGTYKNLYSTYFIGDDLAQIHREKTFDIIVDGYCTNIKNFYIYRKIAHLILSLANKQRTLISICPQNICLDDFIVSKSKELIWKQNFDQFANIMSLRIGEMPDAQFLISKESMISVSPESYIIDTASLTNLIWNNMELVIRYSGEKYNIISYKAPISYSVEELLILISQIYHHKISYQVIPFASNIDEYQEQLTDEIFSHQIQIKNKEIINTIITHQSIDLNSLSQEIFI